MRAIMTAEKTKAQISAAGCESYLKLLDKALKNQNVVRCNEKGVYEQSARDALAEVYHEELGAETKVKEFANQ